MCLAVPGRIESVYEQDGLRMGRVDFGGVVKEVCLACVPESGIGGHVLVHAGFAIAAVDPQAAAATAAELARLDDGGSHAAASGEGTR
jgi:hydrogenase expression/formation protein HypC